MKNQLFKLPIVLFILVIFISGCDKLFSEVKAIEENQKGIDALNEGNSEQSLIHFHAAADLNPEDPETKSTIYRNIALAHVDLTNDDSAVYYHKMAANCYERGDYYYLLNMADADLYSENIGGALSRLLKANAINPNDVGSNNSLGLIYLGEYDYKYYDLDKALKYNKKAFDLNEDRITEQVLAQTYIAMGNHNKALFHLEHVYNEYPGILDDLLELAKAEILYETDADLNLTFQLIEELDASKKEQIEELKNSINTP
ncbi:MAG: hypothetical protein COA58_16085 [Bacteroidetes bacterium]|nr:MAG: hypothetical protein COA58_16085 [Bacteroidota bacterium]